MEEEVQKKSGLERRTEILVAALEKAQQNDGILLNAAQKSSPSFYGKELKINPVNALVMTMHSDQGEFKTNAYTMYSEVAKREEAVRKGQKGVPFVWVNQNEFVNKENPEDKISRYAYNGLSDEAKSKYAVNPKEEVYTLFNIDQTTMPYVHKEEYEKFVEAPAEGDKMDLRKSVNDYIQSIKDNLVTVRKEPSGVTRYDAGKDTLFIPPQKSFPSYNDYVQEVARQVAHATAIPQRLGREGAAFNENNAPTNEQRQQEMLVEELVSSHKMMELGLPARLRSETMLHLPTIIDQLKNNPSFAEGVFKDVNRTVGMIKKAEHGEKITLLDRTPQSRMQRWVSQFPIENVPDRFDQITVLKDDEGRWTLAARPENRSTFAIHPSREDVSLYFDVLKNEADETLTDKFRTQFAQKYYDEWRKNPHLEVNLFKSPAPPQALDMISNVNAFKSRDSKILLVATIDGEKQRPMEISQNQWQRMWLADDKRDYKLHLAAIIYEEQLRKKMDSPEQKAKEEREEKFKEELTRQESTLVNSMLVGAVLKDLHGMKKRSPDTIFLFRSDDKYHLFQEDAEKASKILKLPISRDGNVHDYEGKPLAVVSFPYNQLDSALPKLIRAGERVAICDQIETYRPKGETQSLTPNPPENEQKAEPAEQTTHRGFHR